MQPYLDDSVLISQLLQAPSSAARIRQKTLGFLGSDVPQRSGAMRTDAVVQHPTRLDTNCHLPPNSLTQIGVTGCHVKLELYL